MKLAKVALLLAVASVAAWAQVNAGEQKPEPSLPFTMTQVATFNVQVFDGNGSLVGQAMTPSIPVLGTHGFLLTDLIHTPLPPGILKVVVDGGSSPSSVTFLQFDGDSGTSLQVAYDGPGGR